MAAGLYAIRRMNSSSDQGVKCKADWNLHIVPFSAHQCYWEYNDDLQILGHKIQKYE